METAVGLMLAIPFLFVVALGGLVVEVIGLALDSEKIVRGAFWFVMGVVALVVVLLVILMFMLAGYLIGGGVLV